MRDKFLTEAMGEWKEPLWKVEIDYGEWTGVGVRGSKDECLRYIQRHKNKGYGGIPKGPKQSKPKKINDFSTWDGFGELWEWAQKQEWVEEFLRAITPFMYQCSIDNMQSFTSPDRFANALYEYLNSMED